ncbi:MAG: AAA family ATPase, partial [Deltaproteobacteria bacterium]|nr:AAA family ATPase [Deltaproteobacteria bacterium]
MEGFVSLVDKLGPEDAYAIMDQVYEILIHKVHDYDGTVNEMTGDGIMALFGAPIALEDAPQRAIHSAITIHQEINRFSDRMKQEKGIPPIRMRIGIHTGPVVVGTLGNDLRVEFKAVGDTVNLASRMESLAEPGTTYVTDDTFRLTEGLFRFEALGEKKIKGKEKPTRVYQVIAPSTRRTRFDVSAERGLTPFMGRERERELLLDGYERIKEGRGQAYSIMGEAGVGKSRLLYEFRKAVINEDVTFLEGKCLSYGKGAAYHPIIDILKANFDIHEDEDDNSIRDKVTNGLNTLQMDTPSTLPYFLELLSVQDSGIETIQLSPEGKKERMIESLRQIVLKGAEIRPLIMAIEDLHWVDESTEDALKYLLESIPGIQMLLIFTYRPEYVHTWGGRSYHNQVTLNRLSNRESLMMAANLLRTRDIGRELEDMILTKTEGIPFFIEEFIKSLKDLKIIECKNGSFHITKDLKTVTIPSTIHDVIMARVDSLPQGAKEVLQTGSAIEREFSHDLIKQVTHIPEEQLLSHLS